MITVFDRPAPLLQGDVLHVKTEVYSSVQILQVGINTVIMGMLISLLGTERRS